MKTNNIVKRYYRVPTVEFHSDYFKCPNCGYSEMRKLIGDTAYAPCPKCGHSPLYRCK